MSLPSVVRPTQAAAQSVKSALLPAAVLQGFPFSKVHSSESLAPLRMCGPFVWPAFTSRERAALKCCSWLRLLLTYLHIYIHLYITGVPGPGAFGQARKGDPGTWGNLFLF